MSTSTGGFYLQEYQYLQDFEYEHSITDGS